MARIHGPFHDLGRCEFPLIVGDVIRHYTWAGDYEDYYEIIDVIGDAYMTENRYGSKHRFSESSFTPIDEWYYARKGGSKERRKKKGFGKWFSDVVASESLRDKRESQ